MIQLFITENYLKDKRVWVFVFYYGKGVKKI